MKVAPDPTKWVERYADILYAYADARLDDEHLARDLVQETFMAALEKLDTFKGESSERTWLTAILKYKVIEIYRQRSSARYPLPLQEDATGDFFDADTGHWKAPHAPQPMLLDSPDPMLRKELAALLQRCLRKLPALWLSIFTMKHLDDVATSVICEELRLTQANFWVIIHRAKVNLRACIQKEEGR